MASTSELFDRVQAVVAQKLANVELDAVQAESRFVEDLGASSIDYVELMMGIEDEFDLDEISDDEAKDIATVQHLVDYIATKL